VFPTTRDDITAMEKPPLTRWVRPRLALLALALTTIGPGTGLHGQDRQPPATGTVRRLAEAGPAASEWSRRIEQMQRAGSLRLRSSREDTMIEGRVHDRYDQYAGEARIYGAQLVRQRSAAGVESVFGELHPDDLGIDTTPRLTADDAAGRIEAAFGRAPMGPQRAELVVLPLTDGGYRLAWLSHVWSGRDVLAVFLDARSGEEVKRLSALRRQAAVGSGTGVLGDRKKLASRQISSGFLADDTLRPPSLVTYDMRGNHLRAIAILEGDIAPGQADVASDTDNVWTDGGVVDAHVYIGYTYDYFFQRFNRRGLDGNNRQIRALVNPARVSDIFTLYDDLDVFYTNAGWCGPCGNGQGYMYFGVGITTGLVDFFGQRIVNLAASFDIVAHELAHAVTSYSSDLDYENESGALNESFSDVMAVGAEYYASASGRSARPPDYLLGEDAFMATSRPGSLSGIRSLSNPAQFDQPDHNSRRFHGPEDNGGVHINSGIPNHAFYLAIEGGTNRTSGLAVQGVGAANREQIERIFYRGFTTYLTPTSNFAQARQATLRAAGDLYGDSSAAFRAVSQAWTAVGVN
jgi:thermolysin